MNGAGYAFARLARRQGGGYIGQRVGSFSVEEKKGGKGRIESGNQMEGGATNRDILKGRGRKPSWVDFSEPGGGEGGGQSLKQRKGLTRPSRRFKKRHDAKEEESRRGRIGSAVIGKGRRGSWARLPLARGGCHLSNRR